MSGFPSLLPAFTLLMQTGPQLVSGASFSGTIHSLGPVESGTAVSEPGFGEIPLDGKILVGSDAITIDPDFKAARLDFRCVIRTKDNDHLYFTFGGYIEGNSKTAMLLAGNPDTVSVEHGSAFVHCAFETGSEKYQWLVNKLFVGSQRFIIEPGNPVLVESKVSLVVGSENLVQ